MLLIILGEANKPDSDFVLEIVIKLVCLSVIKGQKINLNSHGQCAGTFALNDHQHI